MLLCRKSAFTLLSSQPAYRTVRMCTGTRAPLGTGRHIPIAGMLAYPCIRAHYSYVCRCLSVRRSSCVCTRYCASTD
nr:MAG TPA: hypothetical protein [Caudoviricetes sp.]